MAESGTLYVLEHVASAQQLLIPQLILQQHRLVVFREQLFRLMHPYPKSKISTWEAFL